MKIKSIDKEKNEITFSGKSEEIALIQDNKKDGDLIMILIDCNGLRADSNFFELLKNFNEEIDKLRKN